MIPAIVYTIIIGALVGFPGKVLATFDAACLTIIGWALKYGLNLDANSDDWLDGLPGIDE